MYTYERKDVQGPADIGCFSFFLLVYSTGLVHLCYFSVGISHCPTAHLRLLPHRPPALSVRALWLQHRSCIY